VTGTESTAARVLSDLRAAQPADPTLQDLVRVVSAKLELCSRLPVVEYEAARAGYRSSATALHDLALVERQSLNELLMCLRNHLEETLEPAPSEEREAPGARQPAS
jgi:hypothetical protein